MTDKQTPQDWADQIAEVSHALGDGMYGKKKKDPKKKKKNWKTDQETPLVIKGQGTSQVKTYPKDI